jgi:tRNA(Ile)-lysidine synthase
MHWDAVELRRYNNALFAMHRMPQHDASQSYCWDLAQPLVIPYLGELRAVSNEGAGLCLKTKQVTVRFRQGGERCYFAERRCHRLLKRLMQEWGVPPWERDRLPLLFMDSTLIAVVGFFLDARYQSMPGYQFFW